MEPVGARRLLGLPLRAATRREALETLSRLLEDGSSATPAWVGFLNANNCNAAMADGEYRRALDVAHAVYPDGVAIAIASRIAGIGSAENLPGTDLVPELLSITSGRGYRCYLLGDTQSTVEAAARFVERRFPGWTVAGAASGYLTTAAAERRAAEAIAEAAPDLLLVGMGTPKQERFVTQYAPALRARLAICVGGLFGYWSRKLVRAPRPVRAARLEWLWILAQQPYKWRRYMIGTARFFGAVLRHRLRPGEAGH